MKIEGANDIPAPRERVWKAFLDPATLARAIPGCEGLEEIGPGEYKAKMKIGVAAIKGTFEGKVRLFDLEPPNRYKMALEGSGGPGFVRGEAGMELSDTEGGTRVSYNADVQVGGLIASVGQRMLGGVSKMMLEQFFTRMTEILAESA
jgi:carbon monoxide dehydrogenase subunit G